MNDRIEVYGYHGTSQTKAASILKNGFLASDNDYNWLGTGIYFFQDAPMRAKQWAIEQHPQEPAVICARIQLDNCIDLFDVKMLDINKSKEILENYFANVTQEQFAIDLEKYCPELVEAESASLASDEFDKAELYQQAKQEGKLEIAPKLLKKGLSIQEVAEILELDVYLLSK
jgi:hypothetical protein